MSDPMRELSKLDPIFSPDFDAYASGKIDVRRVRCALCKKAPCECPPFGTPEYFELIERVHEKGQGKGSE